MKIDQDYLQRYNGFIARCGSMERLPIDCSEQHYILQEALGGSEDESNLIYLAATDHVEAHWLLAKTYGGTMWFHYWRMLLSQGCAPCYYAPGVTRIRSRR